MNLAIDPITTQRIMRVIERGRYRTPGDVVARAVQMLLEDEDRLAGGAPRIPNQVEPPYTPVIHPKHPPQASQDPAKIEPRRTGSH